MTRIKQEFGISGGPIKLTWIRDGPLLALVYISVFIIVDSCRVYALCIPGVPD